LALGCVMFFSGFAGGFSEKNGILGIAGRSNLKWAVGKEVAGFEVISHCLWTKENFQGNCDGFVKFLVI
jgi:hypothetical protein